MTPLDKEVEQALGNLRFPKMDETGSVENNGAWWSRDYRVFDYFTPRTPQEFNEDGEDFDDDDWPRFTGLKKVEDIAKPHFASLIKKGCKLTIVASEKSWFTVSIDMPMKG